MAHTNLCKRRQIFPRFCKLLLKIYPWILDSGNTFKRSVEKGHSFPMTEDTQWSFDTLKQKLTSSPVLMMPDQTQPFQIECDASKYASGAVLTQQDNNGDRHPVAFLSKTFSEMGWNYEIYDRELLAIIQALEEWRHYIQGSGHTTVIYLDHQNLTYFCSAQKLNQRQARWSLYLLEFDVKLVHQPGLKMIQSDALSQRPDLIPSKDTDNEDMTLLLDNLFLNLLDLTLQDRVLSLGQLDDFLNKFSIDDPPFGTLDDWKLELVDGKNTLFYKGRNYVPDDLGFTA